MRRQAPRITAHAVDRYEERVERRASRHEARLALQQLVAQGRSRPRPRHWTKGATPAPGLRFVYWAGRPEVCALVRDGAVVTVLTRELCRGQGRVKRPMTARQRDPEPAWSWDEELMEEAA